MSEKKHKFKSSSTKRIKDDRLRGIVEGLKALGFTEEAAIGFAEGKTGMTAEFE